MKEIVEGFKGLIKNSNRINRLLNSYARLKEKPVENVYLIEKKLSEISKLANNLPDFSLKNSLINWLEQEKLVIEKAKEDFRFLVGERIKELFQKDNIVIRGQFPNLRIGFYTLNLNFEFGEAILYFGPQIERIKSKISLEPQTIYKVIKSYDEDLKKVKFEPREFHYDMKKAYKRRIILSGKTYGEKIPLLDILNEYVLLKQSPQFFIDPKKENFSEFSRIKLSYLLYLYKNSELSERKPHFYVATFDATTDKRRALWIPDNEEGEGTYYSYISFAEED
uniref:Uncharacterized protein n=1 Tax=candidate division WOR-3 bacterium TaxID=2052148 RepID=A0A7C4TGG3_UNCW3